VGGAVVPVVAGLSFPAAVTASISAVLVVAEGVQQLNQWRTNWTSYRAAAEPKQLRWYEIEHDFANAEASFDRLVWLAERLRLKGFAQMLARPAR